MHSLCQLCSKRAATTHLTEMDQNGARRELHLCPQCIQSLELHLEAGPPPIATIIAHQGADPAAGAGATTAPPETGGPACPQCGIAFGEYAGNNLFGCAHDYTAFAGRIDGMLKRYHGANTHVGRTPQRQGAARGDTPAAAAPTAVAEDVVQKDRRSTLEAALRRAVHDEAYEEAARLRDQLRRLPADGPGTTS
jgi:protein arginine kinase activator